MDPHSPVLPRLPLPPMDYFFSHITPDVASEGPFKMNSVFFDMSYHLLIYSLLHSKIFQTHLIFSLFQS